MALKAYTKFLYVELQLIFWSAFSHHGLEIGWNNRGCFNCSFFLKWKCNFSCVYASLGGFNLKREKNSYVHLICNRASAFAYVVGNEPLLLLWLCDGVENKLVQPYAYRNYDCNGHKTCPLYIVAMLLLLFLLMVYDSKKAEFDKFFIVIGARARIKVILSRDSAKEQKRQKEAHKLIPMVYIVYNGSLCVLFTLLRGTYYIHLLQHTYPIHT